MIMYANIIVCICFQVSFVKIFLLRRSTLSLAKFESIAPNTQWTEFKNVDCFNLLLCRH